MRQALVQRMSTRLLGGAVAAIGNNDEISNLFRELFAVFSTGGHAKLLAWLAIEEGQRPTPTPEQFDLFDRCFRPRFAGFETKSRFASDHQRRSHHDAQCNRFEQNQQTEGEPPQNCQFVSLELHRTAITLIGGRRSIRPATCHNSRTVNPPPTLGAVIPAKPPNYSSREESVQIVIGIIGTFSQVLA